MKIKLDDKLKNDQELISKLIELGLTIDDDSEYKLVLVKKDTISCYKISDEQIHVIKLDEINHIVSYGREVIINNIYTVKMNLSEIEKILNDNFVKINISTIININCVKKIIPLIPRKFYITTIDGLHFTVTRKYYVDFKESLKF